MLSCGFPLSVGIALLVLIYPIDVLFRSIFKCLPLQKCTLTTLQILYLIKGMEISEDTYNHSLNSKLAFSQFKFSLKDYSAKIEEPIHP